MPADVIPWSDGKALVRRRHPVGPRPLQGGRLPDRPGQQRPALPGARARHDRLPGQARDHPHALAAADAVAGQVDPTEPGALLLPPVANLRASSTIVAAAVVRAAIDDDVADRYDPMTSSRRSRTPCGNPSTDRAGR